MAENMDEESPGWMEPPANPAHQFLIVPHVLKHLDAYDPIESAVCLEVTHISRDDTNVRWRTPLYKSPLS